MGFNFDLLFRKSDDIFLENLEIFQVTALLFEVDEKKDLKRFSKSDKNIFKSKAYRKGNGKYILPDDLRNRIILNKIGIDKIIEHIQRSRIKSPFSKTIIKVLNNEKINITGLSDNELFYCSKIVDLFPDRLNLDNIKTELQLRQYFSPFKIITKNFAGRFNELEQIAEYIDWLPKKNIISKTVSFIRNTINWHEKPPLLLQGIGGIGKSTLIAKVILDHNNEKKNKKLPFIYVDFDLPGFSISEPISILLEGIRQLSIQYPHNKNIFSLLSNKIFELIYSDNIESVNQSFVRSTESSRRFVLESVIKSIKENGWDVEKFDRPVLVVFDSFEEIQYRVSRDEIFGFLSFIKTISEIIPRLRPIFIGRSDLSDSVLDFKFEVISISGFDYESSCALLNKLGLKNVILCKRIFEYFGGNPLLLMLAANLWKKDKHALDDIEKVVEKKHEFLVSRILDQIHDSEVRQIAVPGLLLRLITTEVIKYILAKPCNLGAVDDKKAERLFSNLSKEAALIIHTGEKDKLFFRQDLRQACEIFILDKYPEMAKQIQIATIIYYEGKRHLNEEYEAEYYFHILKSGNIPDELTYNTYIRLRNKLESSIIELPEKSQLYIKSLIGSRSSEKILLKTDQSDWEKYFCSQIKNGLNGELSLLYNIFSEISQRKDRTYFTNIEFAFYEALICQRLNRITESNRIIDLVLNNPSIINQENTLFPELLFIKAQNFEYIKEYKQALSICYHFDSISKKSINKFLARKFQVLKDRLTFRCKQNIILQHRYTRKIPLFSSSSDFIDSNWIFLLSHYRTKNFCTEEIFNDALNLSKDLFLDHASLEKICKPFLGKYLKDISIQGEFEIVLTDFLFSLEVVGKIDLFIKLLSLSKLPNISKKTIVEYFTAPSFRKDLLDRIIGLSGVLLVNSPETVAEYKSFLNKHNFEINYQGDDIELVYYNPNSKQKMKIELDDNSKYFVPIWGMPSMIKSQEEIMEGKCKSNILNIKYEH